MKKYLIIIVLILIVIRNNPINACTNFIVTKGASADGSVMITYSADSYQFYGELYHFPAAVYLNGTKLDIYEWDSGKFLGRIKQAARTYNVVGNMNENQVMIGETTFGGRPELVNSKGIMDYGSLIYVTLQRAKSARDAIRIMDELVNEYGYHSSGESFSIADANEAWIMEMVGKGEGSKGAIWVAIRIPDGYVSGHANYARITNFALNDPENVLYSKDVISFAREKGYFTGKDKDFSFADAYAPASFGAVRFCDGRVWSIFRRVNKDAEKYISYIKGETNDRMPLFIKPDKKLTLHEVMNLMRDHYEGTEFDMTKGAAAGAYSSPYRWRPLTFEFSGVNYFHERPISTPQTGFSFVAQARSFLPNEIGGIIWFGFDDTYMTVYTPLYASITRIPYNFQKGIANLTTFSWDATFWVFNWVSNMVYPKYSIMIDDIRKVQSELEGQYIANLQRTDETALALYRESKGKAVDFLTDYSVSLGEKTHNTWKKLGEHLIMKFIDGVMKNEAGKVVNIGYPIEVHRQMVEESGDKIRVIKLPGEDERNFNDFINQAEKALSDKRLSDARELFSKALKIKPENNELKIKIQKIETALKDIEDIQKKLLE